MKIRITSIKKCAGRSVAKKTFINLKSVSRNISKRTIRTPSHNGRQINRFIYPIAPAGSECRAGVGVVFSCCDNIVNFFDPICQVHIGSTCKGKMLSGCAGYWFISAFLHLRRPCQPPDLIRCNYDLSRHKRLGEA